MARAFDEEYIQQLLQDSAPDVEVILVETAGAASRRVVRVFIDHPLGVTHERCATVSRILEARLEDDGSVSGDYVIEVSSPGLDRPLRTPAHFAAQRGKRVRVRTSTAVGGRKAWDGTLVDCTPDSIVVRQDGSDVRLDLAVVAKANLVYEFGQGARD